MKSLPQFSVDQTVLVNVLFFVIMLAGLAAYARIPVEFFPDVTLNEATITTVWTGASAEEVERLVTQKLEEELQTVVDIDNMRSVSQADLSKIEVDFDEYLNEVEYEAAVNDVRAALDRVDDLPADAEEPVLTEIKFSEIAPVVMVAVVDAGNVGLVALREVARDVRAQLRDIRGGNRVEIRGERDREVRVLVDRDAASRFGLTVPQISERIRRRNLNLPAGTFESGNGEYTVRAQGDYQSLEELRQTVIAEGPGGGVVRLGELARIEEGLAKARFVTRYNGRPALIVSLTKRADTDTRELVAAVDAWIEGYRAKLPAGIELHKTLDTGRFIGRQMSVLGENLVAGVLFVIAILWFTIGFRNAALTVIAIPFSFLAAMMFFPMFGITINSNTIIGLLLVSGMLVDDAIIVLENIYSRIEAGEELRRAVVKGAEEVLWPVVAAVATTCAAFAPLLLVGGTPGKFMSILPKAVTLCLLASLFECLVILPAHYLDFGSRRAKGADAAPPAGIRGAFTRVRLRVDGGLAWIRRGYEAALDMVLSNRVAFAGLFAAILAVSWTGAGHLKVDLFPGEYDLFNVLLETEPDASLRFTDETVAGYEAVVAEFVGDELEDFSTTVGLSEAPNYDQLNGPYYALSTLVLLPTEENRTDPDRVLRRMRERMETWREAGGEGVVDLRVQAAQNGPPVGAAVDVRLQGDDYALGKAVAGEVKAYLETLPGVYNVTDNLVVGAPEIRLRVDAERAASHSLGFEDVAAALRGANDGVIASSYRQSSRNEDADIRVLLEERYRRGLSDLLDVEVATPEGYLVKLREVAAVEVTRGYRAYHRMDGKRTVSVLADVDETETTSLAVNQKLRARFADLERRYPQLTVQYGGEFASSSEAFADLVAILPAALVAIYMILAALFRSYIQPLVVIAAVPFGFVGIILGVALFQYSVNFFLMYAAVGLTGVVVNDSLVMVDFVNRARREGMPVRDAIMQSGVRRFRPILLTTLTTVCALMPMAFGLQGASKSYGPFAAAICFGLMVAMVGTLFVVPLCYSVLIDTQERLGRLVGSRRPLGTEAVPDSHG